MHSTIWVHPKIHELFLSTNKRESSNWIHSTKEDTEIRQVLGISPKPSSPHQHAWGKPLAPGLIKMCDHIVGDQSVEDMNNDGTKKPIGGLTYSQGSTWLMFLWSCAFQNYRRYQAIQSRASKWGCRMWLEGTGLVLSRHHMVKEQLFSSLSFAYSGRCADCHTGNGYLAGKYLSWLFAP